jgi:uncharacterized protein YecE (DUF72 family)
MGDIEIGTASWTDKTLIASKLFYPRGCNSAEERLRYYAEQFRMVEVDSSYYAMPSETNSQKWVERTPDDFTFNVKAFRLFTGHQTPPKALPADIQHELTWFFQGRTNFYYKDMPGEVLDTLWDRYRRAVAPLAEAGKLGAVHFQFPPWVVPSREWHAHIEECAERMKGFQLATEFRQAKWFDDEHREATLEFERQNNFAHVVLDMPQGFSNSLPQIWEVTSPNLAIVRLHGRNAETWNVKGQTAASDRFNYDYSDRELSEIAPKMRKLAQDTLNVQGIFNNNYEDQGQRNAATLQRLVDEPV